MAPYNCNILTINSDSFLWYDYGALMYDPQIGRWTSADHFSEDGGQESWTQYHYVFNNPIKNTDPDGRIPLETIWDAANVGMGARSFIKNLKEGKIGAAVVDGLGVIVDAAATVVPYVPGGVSAGIKAVR